jgi:hypothetical protein
LAFAEQVVLAQFMHDIDRLDKQAAKEAADILFGAFPGCGTAGTSIKF